MFSKIMKIWRLEFKLFAAFALAEENHRQKLSVTFPFRRKYTCEMPNDDLSLLREYARNNSEMAFAELVSHHVNLVYSVALRSVRDAHLAEEITQAVFIILARKAGSLGDKTILSGWLCRTARYASANALTIQRRRQHREQEVFMQSQIDSGTGFQPVSEADVEMWNQISPLLDGAMEQLGRKDHDALVLRFFENKNFAEVGAALGASEDAVKMRVNRSLEKLRKFFTKRGVSSTTAIIAGTISANSVQATPVTLAKAVTAIAVAKGAASSGSTLTLIKGALKLMAWAKAKTAVVAGAAIILATITTVTVMSHFRSAPPAQSGRLKLPTGNVTPMIAYGYSHDVIILASDGSLWSWGEEILGWPVLGLADTNIQNTVSLRRIGHDNDWTSIAVGDSQNLAIKSDGTLWGWGGNFDYQLGDGTKITRPTPVPSIAGNDWKQAATGVSSFALKNDGTLWAWGNNWDGQLGIGSTKASTNAVQVGTSTNWIKIWGGGIQTVGMQSDGSLWFWGSLSGDSKDTNKFLVPTRISPDTNWVDVCFGYFTMFALKSDGTLWTWGLKADIYNGGPDHGLDGSFAQITPTQIGTEKDWQSISSAQGCFYHILRKKDGSLWALDASEHRTIKSPNAYKLILPRKINFNKDVVAYAAGGDNTGIILTPDGEVWTWGNVLGEHPPSDYFGPNPHEVKFPGIRVVDKPWQVSNIDSQN
jgi:RNA polymerase sigma factor (sigma-70 family)